MQMILINSDSNIGIDLDKTYIITENGNERLGKRKLDLLIFNYFLQ